MLKRKRRRYSFSQTAIIWFVLTMALGMIGVAAAAWQDGLEVMGVVATGEIDPVYTSVSVGSQGYASIVNDGKGISVSINDAYPGNNIIIEYTVTNRGSVPVEFHTLVNDSDSGISVSNVWGTVGGNGDSTVGELLVQVEDVDELSIYGFYLELLFQQWNMAP